MTYKHRLNARQLLDIIDDLPRCEKTPDIIRHELRALFDAGLGWEEARSMVVPVFDNMRAAYRAEWMDWERKGEKR